MPADQPVAHEEQRRVPSALLLVARFALATIAVWVAYALLVDRSRVIEAGAVGSLLERAIGGNVDASFRSLGILYIQPTDGSTQFVARITRSCSVLTPIAVVTWVAICASRGRFVRRVSGLTLALAAVVVADLVRVSTVVVIGSRFGTDVMVVAHDWLGTLITLISVVLGILVLWAVSGGRPRRPHKALGPLAT